MLKNSAFDISVGKLADIVRKRMNALNRECFDPEVMEFCIDAVFSCPGISLMDFSEVKPVIRQVFCTLRCELEILQDYADDPEVTEVMVNGPDSIFIERSGHIEKLDLRFENKEQLEHVIRRLAASVGREINDLNPIVDARLSDGSRVNAVNSNIAINGPILTIRKFSKTRLTMEDLIASGSISSEAADYIIRLVKSAYNIFVSGGTSSGKTTLLNILSDHIPPGERLIVIEDNAELQIRNHENLVRMEAKSANAQGKGAVSIKDLIKASLRMRPDRIIVGEVRGAEVMAMIFAMATGHDGSLSTGHSNSCIGMIRRLEAMFLSESSFPLEAVQGQLAEGIEIMIHLERDSKGIRRICEINEFCGYENGEPLMNELFKYDMQKGLYRTKNQLKRNGKLLRNQT